MTEAVELSAGADRFSYILDKIIAADFIESPFRHIEIGDLLTPEHFNAITSSAQIELGIASDTPDLFGRLAAAGYEPVDFPGCVTSEREYLDWFSHGRGRNVHDAIEGFGIVYRLKDVRDDMLRAFDAFMRSDALMSVLVEKFGINRPVKFDVGIQKYLHGYEISPHPDIRQKALTWMLNINTGAGSETAAYHTHYMSLKPEWRFIETFWKGNPTLDRDWMPWAWCETQKQQTANNSIVFFSPSDDTVHAIKAHYDHLPSQRTQLYGNLWYEYRDITKVAFADLDIVRRTQARAAQQTPVDRIKASWVGDWVRAAKKVGARATP